jgi:hypothetical protein
MVARGPDNAIIPANRPDGEPLPQDREHAQQTPPQQACLSLFLSD